MSIGSQQRFVASVVGTGNQSVTWNINGTGCNSSGACGSIDSSGLYVAPQSAPSPNAINVVATSSDDTGQTGAATVTISGAPNISAVSPSSAYAGSAGGFTLEISGNNFASSSPGPGSTILIAGGPRTTSCVSGATCTTSLSASDLQFAGSLSVRLQNPDGTFSNA